MPRAADELLMAHSPLILAGVSGSGKDAIAECIRAESDWRHVVTHTSRQLRPEEENGKQYWFVGEEEMLQMAKDGEFIEIKWIHDSQVSGSSIKAYNSVIRARHKPMMYLDVQGIETILEHGIAIRPFFILPPSFDVWIERLDKRGRMSHVERTHRLRSAKKELEVAIRNDKFVLVINDEIPRVSREILQGFSDSASQHRHRELAKQLIDHIQAY